MQIFKNTYHILKRSLESLVADAESSHFIECSTLKISLGSIVAPLVLSVVTSFSVDAALF